MTSYTDLWKRTTISLDPVRHEPVLREMENDDEKNLYFFGETVGLLVLMCCAGKPVFPCSTPLIWRAGFTVW
ncbi:MAG: hypothetical protein OXE42_02460 [Gammaproteobacteria bacterium]|nr:hypothetical protein [Gammaproteobacteria bacterium]